ncbi:MAG: iron-containing alcohol dehydrogenase [Deltaproteobacteria bacterium]|nr:iron-containing alcohol dehydrogenase [Deltaproteobacteria bacterium]
MACAHGLVENGDEAFSIDASNLVFGRGVLAEVGDHVRALLGDRGRRVAIFTDRRLAGLVHVAKAKTSLVEAGLDVVVYDACAVEPTDASFLAAAAFAREGAFDAFVSVGGGSVIDTCKGAALYATYPADFLTYVNKPVGAGAPVPGPLPPHVACPTTCGTGSETTGIAVCDVLSLHAKTGIASRRLRPTMALVDATCPSTLPSSVVAASGFDVLCHALESYTARPHGARVRADRPSARPMSQGSNPWSDLGSLEALRLGGLYLERAVRDASDVEAREQLAWAASLAGIAFGNAGVHVPHGMAYAIAGLVRSFRMDGYPGEEPLVPHGVSVVLGAPSVFRATSAACPERHLACAKLLGADARGADPASPSEAGELLSLALERLMRATGIPTDLRAVGYHEGDVDALVAGTIVQRRLLDNAPITIGAPELAALFRASLPMGQGPTGQKGEARS